MVIASNPLEAAQGPEMHRVVTALRDMGVEPFAQPYRDYDGGEPTAEQTAFARWVDQKMVFQSCSWDEYKQKKGIIQ